MFNEKELSHRLLGLNQSYKIYHDLTYNLMLNDLSDPLCSIELSKAKERFVNAAIELAKDVNEYLDESITNNDNQDDGN